MARTTATPWLHRWARPLMGAIALLGLGLTTTLTWSKLTGQTLLCPSSGSGCQAVLNSPYATVFGLPLSLYGMAAYSLVAIAVILPQLCKAIAPQFAPTVKDWTAQGLLWLTLAMVIVSGYLMTVLIGELHTFCPYCLASATFTLSLFLLSLGSKTWDDWGQLVSGGIIVGLITVVTTLGVFAQQVPVIAQEGDRLPIPALKTAPHKGIGWEIVTRSGPDEIALAKHLRDRGIKMYGAYWCPHCTEQKLLFGKQAFGQLDYVECGKGGKNAQVEQCQAVGIKSFPTWDIDGELQAGIQTLEELAAVSGYEGSQEFHYFMPGL